MLWRLPEAGEDDGATLMVRSAQPSGRLFRSWQLPRVGVTHGPNFRSLDRRGARSVVTVHDLAFLHFPEDYPRAVVEPVDPDSVQIDPLTLL